MTATAARTSRSAAPAAVQRAPDARRSRGTTPPSALSLWGGARMGLGTGVQAKLEVNQPGDRFEHQAEHVAGRVMRSPEPGLAGQSLVSAAQNPRAIQRKADSSEQECIPCAQNPRKLGIQRLGSGVPVVTPHVATTLRQPGAGRPLPDGMRRRIEPHVGADLGNVRLHDDAHAGRAARSLGAVAFTHQNHIFLKHGGLGGDLSLMAHESTHVVQQGAAQAQQPAPVQRAPDIQREESSFSDDLAKFGGDVVGGVANLGAEALEAIVRKVAPKVLVDLIDKIKAAGGIFEYLKDKLSSVLDSVFDTLSDNTSGSVNDLIETFRDVVEAAPDIVEALANDDCEPLFDALGQLGDALGTIAGEAWDWVVDELRPVGEFFSDLWSDIGAPAIDWLKDLGGEVWDGITEIADEIWSWTEPIRAASEEAWNWVKKLLGINSSDEGGLSQWIMDKVGEAWDTIKDVLEPLIEPIRSFADEVMDFLPLDEILDLRKTVEGWVERAKSMSDQMAADGEGEEAGVVANRDTLRKEILPAVKKRITELGDGLVDAGDWISDQISAIGDELTGFMDDLRDNEYLGPLAGVISWVEDMIDDLVSWAEETVEGLFDLLRDGLQELADFVEPVFDTLEKIVAFVGDILGNVADLVLGPLDLIPECISKPIKDFIINTILKNIPLFGQLLEVPDIWEKLKQTAIKILKQIFVDGDLFMAAWTFFKTMISALGISPKLVTDILSKALQAFGDILKDPVGFLKNLVKAITAGFQRFLDNIGKHMVKGVIDWLFGSLKDMKIERPKDFSLGSIFGVVLQVLGITYPHIMERLRKKDKKAAAFVEKAVNLLSGAWEWVKVLIDEGPAGLWKKAKDKVGDLKDQLIQGAIGWLTGKIIAKVAEKLLTSSDPLGIGATINTIITIIDTIETVVRYANDILEMVNTTLDGIGGIVKGAIGQAAGFLEKALANAIPVAIGFMLGVVGLGDVSEGIRETIEKVRKKVDEGIDWLIDKGLAAVDAIKKALGLGKKEDEETGVRALAKADLIEQLHEEHSKEEAEHILAKVLDKYRPQGLKRLELGDQDKQAERTIFAEASPYNELFKLVPKRRTALMGVTLRLSGKQPLTEGVTTKLGTQTSFDESGEATTSAIPAPLIPVSGKAMSGGLLVPPKEGGNTVQLVSWNTGELDPKVLSNSTHAEAQFIGWFERQPWEWRRRVQSIDVRINLSPCTSCSNDLTGVLKWAPNLVNASLTYEQPYVTGQLATTSEALGKMKGWKISGPSLGGEKEKQSYVSKE